VVNRFTAADFNQYISGFNRSAGLDFSVSNLSYDANGNILAQRQKGWKLSGSALIDDLTYNYIANRNKLLNVIDAQNDPETKLGDFRTSTLHPNSGSKPSNTTDYVYNDDGRLVKDLNKDIIMATMASSTITSTYRKRSPSKKTAAATKAGSNRPMMAPTRSCRKRCMNPA